MIYLMVRSRTTSEEKQYAFEQNLVKVGRLAENDVPLSGGSVSREHFAIALENGEYVLSDLSSNGTSLNGATLGKGKKKPLREGDAITAGEFDILFRVNLPEDEFEKTTEFLQKKFVQLLSNPTAESIYPYLLVAGGPTNGVRVELVNDREEIMMGRTPDCPLQVPVLTVSKNHARIIKRGLSVEIEDLGSSNGTRVNGQPVSGTAPLNDRDEIVLGQVGEPDPIKVVFSFPSLAQSMGKSRPESGEPPQGQQVAGGGKGQPPTAAAPHAPLLPSASAPDTKAAPTERATAANQPPTKAEQVPATVKSEPPRPVQEAPPPAPPQEVAGVSAQPPLGQPDVGLPPVKAKMGFLEKALIGIGILAIVAVGAILFLILKDK